MSVSVDRSRFYGMLSAAIADLVEHGFDSQERLEEWLRELRLAAQQALIPESVLAAQLRESLTRTFRRATTPRQFQRRHKGVPLYTLERIKPRLRAELDRRILASANLITLNRDASIEKTLQRFAGWATSIPIGGSDIIKRRATGEQLRRGIAALPFEERRVITDQNAKLVAAINDIAATDDGAIIATWHHVHPGPHYESRPAHVARDGKVFLIRNSWAIKDGLIKLAGHQYTDQIEQPGELVYCGCWYEYGYTLFDVPREILTEQGRLTLAKMKEMGRAA